MTDAPERIWALQDLHRDRVMYAYKEPLIHDHTKAVEYLRADLAPDVAVLVEALRRCVAMLGALVAESGRGVEWGEEDAFRMGEWFERDDLLNIEQARAALAAWEGRK